MNLIKAGAGLTLGLLTTFASSAFAARFEVTYTTTFTTVTSTFDCGDCGQPPTWSLSPMAPISMTNSVVLDIQDSQIRPTEVITLPWVAYGNQHMGQDVQYDKPWTPFVPAALLGDAGIATPSSGLGIQRILRTRASYGDLDDPSVRKADSWGFNQVLGWTAQDGTQVDVLASMFHVVPFPVTFENLGASLTGSQLIERMLQDFWCAGCETITSASLYTRLNGASRGTSYNGTVTAFSIRDLDAVAAVPEPSTYALMLAGVAAIGFAARSRQKR